MIRALTRLAIIAIIAYIGTACYELFYSFEAVAVPPAQEEIVAPITGVFLREEYVLPYEEEFLPELYEGEKLARGKVSEHGGVFTAMLDGYEHVNDCRLHPSEIMQILEDKRIITSSVGKLITSDKTRFYCIIESKYVKYLQIMSNYIVSSPKYDDIEFQLVEVGDNFQQFTAILLSTNEQMSSIMNIRSFSGTMGIK